MRKLTIDELVEWNERRGRSAGGSTAIQDLESLLHAWHSNSDENFLHFLPIRTVTILEVFLRETVREIVDFDAERLARAQPLARGQSFKFDFLSGMHGRKFTPGQVIAHALSVNRLDDIQSPLGTLVEGCDRKLRAAIDPWEKRFGENDPTPLLGDKDETLRDLKELFQVRHILVHERPEGNVLSADQAVRQLEAAIRFAKATDAMVTLELHGDVPLTQMDMNQYAADRHDQALERYCAITERVRGAFEGDEESLSEVQDAFASFDVFADKHATMMAAEVRGGSMWPMVYSSERESLVDMYAELLNSASWDDD